MELLRASALSAKGYVRSIGAAQWAAYLALLQCWVQRAVRRVEAAQLRAGRHHDPRKWGPSGGRGWSCQESRKQAVLGAARRVEGGGHTPTSKMKALGSEVLHGAAKRAASKRCWAQRGVRRVEAARQFHMLLLLKGIEGQYFV